MRWWRGNLRVLRQRPRGVACRAAGPRDRPCGLRRLLCQRGEVLPAGAARPAGDHRRRRAGRSVDLLLCGAALWVRSAMPMFKARSLCPQAVIIKPGYGEVRRGVGPGAGLDGSVKHSRLVRPPFLRRRGSQPLPAPRRFTARRQPSPSTVSPAGWSASSASPVSFGLARNRLLAKLAAERGKPRGFCVLGSEGGSVMAPEPSYTAAGRGAGPRVLPRLG